MTGWTFLVNLHLYSLCWNQIFHGDTLEYSLGSSPQPSFSASFLGFTLGVILICSDFGSQVFRVNYTSRFHAAASSLSYSGLLYHVRSPPMPACLQTSPQDRALISTAVKFKEFMSMCVSVCICVCKHTHASVTPMEVRKRPQMLWS